jgi:hypothetical protein
LLVVADVAGKGVPAALIMSGLRTAMHLCVSLRLGIEETLQRMNRLLPERGRGSVAGSPSRARRIRAIIVALHDIRGSGLCGRYRGLPFEDL